MIQKKTNCLAINLACPSNVAVDQPVVLDTSANLTVKAIDAAADINFVGRVDVHQGSDLFATISMGFKQRRDDMEAAEVVQRGAFVRDATGKAVSYTPAVYGVVVGDNAQPFAPVAIVSVAGTGTQPFLPVLDTTDKVKIKVGTAESQTFTLAATDTTAQLVADKLNITAVGFVASAVGGSVVLTASAAGDAIAIETVANDDYTELGFTVASSVASYKLKIKIGTGTDQTFLLANSDTTAALVCTKINATAVGFIAAPTSGNKVQITSSDLQDAIEIKTIALDCYTILGFTAAVTEPTDRSHDPGAIAGLIIKLPDPCAVIGAVSGPFAITNGVNDAVSIVIGTGQSQVFDLTAGTARTPTQICADINATATDFTAVPIPGGYVKLLADDPFKDIEIETVSNSAYDALGFTAAVTAAPMTIETLEK